MGTPELYLVACCVKVTKCTDQEVQKLIDSGEKIICRKETAQTTKPVDGYLIEYPDIKFWRETLNDKYFKYTEVKNNPIAIKVFNYIKSKHIPSTGVSK